MKTATRWENVTGEGCPGTVPLPSQLEDLGSIVRYHNRGYILLHYQLCYSKGPMVEQTDKLITV